ncbi:glycosyltransferase [Iodobacter fluviatilis]|uniref:Glycosyl transferase family 1 domain-containing protein n=1 Tax=Iodobacter fluviatilis TaxID=537 RepID=A0A7G3G6L5_9NEIS|nr:glycosyltransferase [Iodobacter fluviatilis]QBC43120.1 hypothetical protein C1H71_05860 [Iodobacter fluviatilis]
MHNILSAGLKVNHKSYPWAWCKNHRWLERVAQVYWLIFWPLHVLRDANTIVVAHSFFVANPLVYFIRNKKMYNLFQGEEFLLLAYPFNKIVQYFFYKEVKFFLTLPTNKYLAQQVVDRGGDVYLPVVSLGPKRFFYKNNPGNIASKKIIIFARDGANKGVDLAIELYKNKHTVYEFVFIAAGDLSRNKLSINGINYLADLKPEVVSEVLSSGQVLFLPSSYEGLSLPMLEAVAAGMMVVTCTDGFPRWAATQSNRIIYVEDKSLNKIEIALSKAFLNLGATGSLGRDEVFHVENYSFEGFCKDIAAEIVSSSA